MHIIKVSATESTNSLAREWFNTNKYDSPICIIASNQTSGRGQRGARWVSNAGENLTFSVIYPKPSVDITDQFLISAAVGLQLLKALKQLKINNLKLKWPNDIMADGYKIGGVLIENILQNNQIGASIIGIGLNVNQVDFPELPKAASLKNLTGTIYATEEVLSVILEHLEKMITSNDNSFFEAVLEDYETNLFRRKKASTFQLKDGSLLIGIILGVTPSGLLKLKVEDEEIRTFDLKELKLLF
ncbi:BirA family biotin operon repressor/biotin-[acetyl-CoA-carboxylase] ligase [Gillisia sp. Hel_I_86]|uniref:biotin--[acetyl-CoA-carboxylase] ligase n=1 Tax=Gillisia sp. Hel_I_86 TaxID=1249981 RepID=UPI00119C2A0C|nr:biotin--[acetyl-CoA-carboxylase] ligase [Gillisia sp. Hel_I_86]TVZ27405.1 BirA family biotin operon repressor/biotin-[acetyl-CoA-carboxylase] ligase [Gillisia sp. Hel_I_86]